MERRVGQLAGLLAFALVIARLGRLLQSGPGLPNWTLILLASAVLGGVVWWLLDQLLQRRTVVLIAFAAAASIMFLRISVPLTLIAGVIPSTETPSFLAAEMDQAVRLIRSGVPPIIPIEGVVAILAVLVWVTGALFAWGVTRGPVAAIAIPSLVLYLQFAVFDRSEAGLGWMAPAALVVGLTITALGLERRGQTGRVRDTAGRGKPRRSIATALTMAGSIALVATLTADSASGVVSEYGNLPWRTGTSGYGLGRGGFALDRFVDLKQSLISRDNQLLFTASFDGRQPPASQIYWRLETLDTFDGTGWRHSPGPIRSYEPGRPVGDPSNVYQGSTSIFTHRIHVSGLRQEVVPTAGAVGEIRNIDLPGSIEPRAFQFFESDGAILYGPRLRDGDVYEVTGIYPLQTQDLGALAADSEGNLSPLFASASEAGLFQAAPRSATGQVLEPPDLEFFTELPEGVPAAIRGVATLRTRGATTDFERAWMLQHWFRDSGDFIYSTNVDSGHTPLDLENWLVDTTSLNYRTGYCEQFATSMAVLGRSLGIPSRVVLGFTPGTPAVSSNGVNVIQVRDTNAHAWVEMWMDGFGWVRFDPTPRGEFQPESLTAGFDPADFLELEDSRIDLEAPDLGAPIPDFGFEDDPPFFATSEGSRWWLMLLPALLLLALIVPGLKSLRRRNRLTALKHGDITAAWDEILDRLTDLGEEVAPSKTPMEFANDTDPALLPVAVKYSSTIYGERRNQGELSDLLAVEGWLQGRYDGMQRTKAAMSLRSLAKRYLS